MPSRLSSLLVRDGLVGVKRMEKAFQRQVIYGGSLDTILLEMSIVAEDRLMQYLSLATGLPPATRTETDVFDMEAVRRCPQEVARAHRVVPLCFEGGALRVLVYDPVDLGQMERLADELDLPIQPLVVPEYRFHLVFSRMFGGMTDARFAKLAAKAEEAPSTRPVGRAASVIVESQTAEPGAEHVVVDVGVPPSAVLPASARQDGAPGSAAGNDAQARREREAVSAGGRGAGGNGATQDATIPDASRGEDSPAAPSVADRAPDADAAEPANVRPPSVTEGAAANNPGPAPAILQPGVLESSALSVVEARALLADADDRDAIFMILLRAIRRQAWFAGLLTIQGGAAIGRIALVGDATDREHIAQVLIPLDVGSAFRSVVTGAAPFVGAVATGEAEIDRMIERMGGVVPPSALLLPIALKQRVVALAVGHRGNDAISIADVSELLPLAGSAADALSRLIVKAKAAAARRAPTGSEDAAPADATQEVSLEAEEPGPVEQVLAVIEAGDPADLEDAMNDCLRRPEATLALLTQRFPGPLHPERYGQNELRAADHGPLLDLIMRMGSVAAELLADKMRDPARETRYYATMCAAEMRPSSLLESLVERVFDTDYGVRQAALEGLAGYPSADLEPHLTRIRQVLHSDDVGRAGAAAEAIACLADTAAIPALIDALSRSDKGSEHARRSLVVLAKQDFGTSARKWRGWWTKHQDRHRIEWLIDGLGHRDEDIRRAAGEELRRLTGEYFGYHHDLSKKEREQAKRRWEQWWSEVGRRRFVREQDERHRPTAMLPSRREP